MRISVVIDEETEAWLSRRADVIGTTRAAAARRVISDAVGADRMAVRDDVWFARGTHGITPESKSRAASQASNVSYGALIGLFEHLEHKRLIHGNGHHMAQQISAAAGELIEERWEA